MSNTLKTKQTLIQACAALKQAQDIIMDKDIDMDIKDAVFDLSHAIIDLLLEKTNANRT